MYYFDQVSSILNCMSINKHLLDVYKALLGLRIEQWTGVYNAKRK